MPNAHMGFFNREGRNEFQLFIAAFCLLSGGGQIVFGVVPAALAFLDQPFPIVWAWSVSIAGVMMLASALWHDPHGLPLYLEIGGLFAGGCATAAYVAAVLLENDWPVVGLYATYVCIGASAAMFSRCVRVIIATYRRNKYQERLHEEVRAQMLAEAERIVKGGGEAR